MKISFGRLIVYKIILLSRIENLSSIQGHRHHRQVARDSEYYTLILPATLADLLRY